MFLVFMVLEDVIPIVYSVKCILILIKLHKQLYYFYTYWKSPLFYPPCLHNKTSTNYWFLGDNPIGPYLFLNMFNMIGTPKYDRVLQNPTSISVFFGFKEKANVPCQIASVFVHN
jgi:hypothetical protein